MKILEPIKFMLYKDGKLVSDYCYTKKELAGMFGVAEQTIMKWRDKTFREGYQIKEAPTVEEKKWSPADKKIMKEWDRVTARFKKRGKGNEQSS